MSPRLNDSIPVTARNVGPRVLQAVGQHGRLSVAQSGTLR